MLHKMASCDVGMRKPLSVCSIMLAVVSCVFCRALCNLVAIQMQELHAPQAIIQDSLIFPRAYSTFPSFVWCISVGFFCRVWFPHQTGGYPLSNVRNANGWWGWGLCSWLRGSRCWVKCYGGSLPRSDCPASLPPVVAQSFNPGTGWLTIQQGCLCLWGHHYNTPTVFKGFYSTLCIVGRGLEFICYWQNPVTAGANVGNKMFPAVI